VLRGPFSIFSAVYPKSLVAQEKVQALVKKAFFLQKASNFEPLSVLEMSKFVWMNAFIGAQSYSKTTQRWATQKQIPKIPNLQNLRT
jgi:hypothetical protein